MRKILTILIFTILTTLCVHSQETTPQGDFLEKRGAVEGGYNFWLYVPEEYKQDNHPLPLIIFLHGASLCGNNLDKVRRYGVLDAIDDGMIIPMFVLAPQNPGGSWSPKKLNDLLEWAKANYNIDTNRVYVLGMSLGGYGTMDFAGTYPEKIAAAMALCGGTTLKDMSGIGKLPMWIMHGTADKAVSVNESKKVVDYLQKSGNDKLLRYDWIAGGSHGLLARCFYMQETYDWLLTHSLADNPREIDTDITITKEDINKVYTQRRSIASYYDAD